MVRVFLQSADQSEACMMLDEPRSLLDGKTAWHCSAAERECWSTAREHGHRGYVVTFHCWDLALFESMQRQALGTHELVFTRMQATGQPDALLLYLKDLPVCVCPARSTTDTTVSGGVQRRTVTVARNLTGAFTFRLSPFVTASTV